MIKRISKKLTINKNNVQLPATSSTITTVTTTATATATTTAITTATTTIATPITATTIQTINSIIFSNKINEHNFYFNYLKFLLNSIIFFNRNFNFFSIIFLIILLFNNFLLNVNCSEINLNSSNFNNFNNNNNYHNNHNNQHHQQQQQHHFNNFNHNFNYKINNNQINNNNNNNNNKSDINLSILSIKPLTTSVSPTILKSSALPSSPSSSPLMSQLFPLRLPEILQTSKSLSPKYNEMYRSSKNQRSTSVYKSILTKIKKSSAMSPKIPSSSSSLSPEFNNSNDYNDDVDGDVGDDDNDDDDDDDYDSGLGDKKCRFCKLHAEAKLKNIESIKNHILHRLELIKEPNLTSPNLPRISEQILNNFYAINGKRYIRIKKPLNNDDDEQHVSSMMQGDDPNSDRINSNDFNRTTNSHLIYDSKEYLLRTAVNDEIIDEDTEYFSTTDRIYLFPNILKARHRGEVLEFSVQKNTHLRIEQAIFHLNLLSKSDDETDQLLTNKLLKNHNDISISINRIVRRPFISFTRSEGNFKGTITKGEHFAINFNITDMLLEWINSPNVTHEIVIKTQEPWMRSLLELNAKSDNGPYIEMITKNIKKKRTKRQLSLTCGDGNTNESRCCRYPLMVDFRRFGWDWIIAPDRYEAYYCSGECSVGFLPRHPHSYVFQLSTSFSPCCTPRKLNPLSLLYFDDHKQVIHSVLPNMAVEKCSCG